MVQSGLNYEWWRAATNCYSFLRNVVDVLVCGSTAWKKRFGEDFKGPIIPFGAECKYKPIYDEDKKRLHKLGAQMLDGIFIAYAQHVVDGWNGDVDTEEIDNAE